ncbi:MAG: DUF3352 domain-containing protein [Coleofasciculus sp. C1-SOL-03]|uniref:DUF3352 domain-containing protein n=1 Tax=Coleofasciculus sp. C1-SOL-03 TaxID=3069522 RepID=UPI0032F2CE5D
MLKKNKLVLRVTLALIVILMGGSVIAYSLFVQHNLWLAKAPAGTKLVPQDTLITAIVSTESGKWRQLQRYGTPNTLAAFVRQLAQLEESLLTENGYDYEDDIQPWLGETVMIAYQGDSTSAPETESEQTFPVTLPFIKLPDLIILPIDNPAHAKEILAKTKTQKVTQFGERTYRGVQIRETQKPNRQNYSVTVLERFVVVTSNPQTMEEVIDTYKGITSVASTPGYIEALATIDTTQAFAQVYLNLPTFTATAAANSARSLSPEQLAERQPLQGLVTSISLESDGIRFRGMSWLKPNSQNADPIENTSSRLPRRLPANTRFMVSGSNFAQLWQSYAQNASANPLIPIPPANLSAGIQTTLGVDVQEDLLPWMAGEWVIALIPATEELLTPPENQPPPMLGAGITVMILSSDRAATEQAFQQLDQVMETRYQLTVEKTQLNSQPVVRWTSPLGGITATHGWLEGNIAFLTFGAPIANAIVPQPQAPLTQTPLFQQIVPTQPRPHNGQVYIEVERLLNRDNLNLPQLPSQLDEMMQAIRAIGLTTAGEDQRNTRFDLFVKLETMLPSNPVPVPSSPIPSP